jgi:tetratricopeptide (TPR) repeat protein
MQAFQQATVLHAQGRLWDAEQLYEIALKADDRHFDSVYRLGLIRLQQTRLSDAAALFRRALKIDRDSADAHLYLGVALTGLQRLDDAVPRYARALAIKPDFPEAHNNLGYVLQRLGRHKEAAGHFEDALAVNPAYPEARNNLGNALQMLGRSQEAIAQYERAIALKPNYAEAHNNLGNVLETLDRHEEAIAHYEKALAIRPDYVEAHYSFGKALGALGRHDEAIARFQQALAIDPNSAEVHNTLGNLLFVLGRVQEALGHCEKALVIDPNHVGAHNNLGLVLRALGRLDEAIRIFEKAIALAPRNAGAYLNLATSRRFDAAGPHFTAMKELERDVAALDTEDQIGLHFALGKVFADLEDRGRSTSHLLRGNALKRRRIRYDEATVLKRFDRIRAVFTAELMRDKRGPGEPSPVPVFIVGMPRAGTTLIEQILASHPKVFGAGELREFGKAASAVANPDRDEFPEAVATFSGSQLQQLGAKYVSAIRTMAPAAERITDKMPGNLAYAGLIHLALPHARIIHARRDPRDIALSCFSILFAYGHEHTYDLEELGRYVRAYLDLIEHWRKVLPQGVMLEVDYEDVVDDLEQQARRVVTHCGLEWEDACLSFYKTQRPVRTASVTQVRQPIYRGSVGRWRDYEELLQPFLKTLYG